MTAAAHFVHREASAVSNTPENECMILIATTWTLLFILLTLLGSGVCSIFSAILGSRYYLKPSVPRFAWFGYAALIAFLQIYSIFLPVNGHAVIAVSCLAIIAGLSSRNQLAAGFNRIMRIPAKIRYIVTISVVFITACLAYNSTLLPLHYDTELYHLNVVKWTSGYPAVPGIVNLHGRLAFNSSFHLFAAFTNTWLWTDRAVYIANGFLILLLTVQWITHIIMFPRLKGHVAHPFVFLTFPLVITASLSIGFPSLSTDTPLYVLCLVIIYEIMSLRVRPPKEPFHWHDCINRTNFFAWGLVLSLTTVLLTTKMSGVPFCIIIFPISIILLMAFSKRTLSSYFSIRHIIMLYVLPLMLITGMVVRAAILSGWLVYPFPIGNLHLEWSATNEQVRNMLNWAMSWSRLPGVRPEIVLGKGISFWIVPWFTNFKQNYVAIILLCAGITGMFSLAVPGLVKSFNNTRIKPLLMTIAVSFTSLIYWFFSAPEYRFGEAFFWIFAATSLSPLAMRILSGNFHRHLASLIIITILVFIFKFLSGEIRIPYFIPSQLIDLPPRAVPRQVLTTVVINNMQSPPLIIYKPEGDDRCGNSPLPCSPYVDENSTIELRVPGDLSKGFRVTGSAPPDMSR